MNFTLSALWDVGIFIFEVVGLFVIYYFSKDFASHYKFKNYYDTKITKWGRVYYYLRILFCAVFIAVIFRDSFNDDDFDIDNPKTKSENSQANNKKALEAYIIIVIVGIFGAEEGFKTSKEIKDNSSYGRPYDD